MSIILRAYDKEVVKTLSACGVPAQDMVHGKNRIQIENILCKITQDIPGTPTKVVSTGKQLAVLNKILEHPIRGSYTLCISSYPTDLRAKQLASFILRHALEMHSKRKAGRGMPIWHRVYGGLGDPLRDKDQLDKQLPAMLVLANILEDSTNYKIEKVRDLLEKYSSIPRIVVTGGIDPCSFFIQKMKYPLNAGIYLGPDNRIEE